MQSVRDCDKRRRSQRAPGLLLRDVKRLILSFLRHGGSTHLRIERCVAGCNSPLGHSKPKSPTLSLASEVMGCLQASGHQVEKTQENMPRDPRGGTLADSSRVEGFPFGF